MPEYVRGDFSPTGINLKLKCFFDAIVTDPPYGIRAGARKSGTRKEIKQVKTEEFESHVPMSSAYDGEEVMQDLLRSSSLLLKMGGRLIYLYPVETIQWNELKEACLPKHSCFRLLFFTQERMRAGMSRILVTMEKIKEP